MSACPGCGLDLPDSDGPTHPYIGASAACWALYGELRYAPSHRSVAVHLMALCLVLEREVATVAVRELMDRILRAGPELEWLEPPSPNGAVTVRDVLASRDLAEHKEAVEHWAADVWSAWSPHHEPVRGRIGEAL